MPNEPIMQLPYPDDEDWLSQGAYAIEQLAREVGERNTPDGFAIGYGDSGTTTGLVGFPGGVGKLDGFTFDGVTLTRTGPPRVFIIYAEVAVQVTSAGASSLASSLQLLGNGVVFAEAGDSLQSSAADLTARDVVHRITAPVILNPGDFIQVNANGGGGAVACGACTMRAYPITPAFS